MVKELKLNAKIRKEKKARQTREENFVPAIVYGNKQKNTPIKISKNEVIKFLAKGGDSSLIDLEIDSQKPIKVILKDMQKSNIKEEVLHLDFYQVDLKKKVEVEIPLEFINESPAEKERGGTLLRNLETLSVMCLPEKIIKSIKVDLSQLKDLHDSIKVKDLILGDDYEIHNEPEEMIVGVMTPKVEEIITPKEVVDETKTTEEDLKKQKGETPEKEGNKTNK